MQSVVGEIYDGKVTGLTSFGAFVKLSNGESGMVHISEVAPVFVKEIKDFLTEGQDVRVKVLAINENNKISLSIKQAQAAAPAAPKPERKPFRDNDAKRRPVRQTYASADNPKYPASAGPMSFEDMMSKLNSEEKMSDLRRAADNSRGRRGNR